MEYTQGRQVREVLFWGWFLYGAFLLYGSLMPFRFQWLAFDDAWIEYLAGAGKSNPGLSLADFITNIFLYVPLGFLGTGALNSSLRRSTGLLVLVIIAATGTLLSGLIEFLQLYFPPRVSWRFDLIANCLGSLAGYFAWRAGGDRLTSLIDACLEGQRLPVNLPWTRRWLSIAGIAYLVGLAFANNWYGSSWLPWSEAMLRLPSINLLPFFYHQEASTWLALESVLWHFGWYVPVGVVLLGVTGIWSIPGRSRLMLAAMAGAAVAAVIEAGKLFIVSRHPDSGNIVVGGLASALGLLALPCLFRPKGTVPSVAEVAPKRSQQPTGPGLLTLSNAGALGIFLVSLAVAAQFPVQPGLLSICLVGYAFVLSRRQHAWLWVLPAALPVLDLAPYSGWFFLDEFDLLVLITLAVSIWQRRDGIAFAAKGAGYWFTALFAVSTLISLILGLLPLQALDLNAFSHYFSHYNALRVVKGLAWAILLAHFAVPSRVQEHQAIRQLSVGIVIGLMGASALAVWERAIYPGLWNFASEFRIGAFFSSMHNGGSHIEAYFSMAMPFALLGAWSVTNRALRIALFGLFLISGYVVLVTFARGGYAAFALASLIFAASIWRAVAPEKRGKAALALGGLASLSFALSLPVLLGAFAQQRLAATGSDFGIRTSHWEEARQLIKPGLLNSMFGMGLGRFPETYYFGSREGNLPALFRYGQDSGNRFLMLGTGNPLYVEQVVDVGPGQKYRLSVDTRSAQGKGLINALLCERTYFFSYGCVSATLAHEGEPGKWIHHEAEVASGQLGAGPWLGRRAVKLSLENAAAGTTIDVDNVALRNDQGADLVANGDFEKGHSNWFFTSTFNHLPWHIKNLWIGVLFDQGWFGLLAFTGLVFVACLRLTKSAWNGNLYAGASLASATGFLCVGLFDSLFDAPRLITFFFLILFCSGALLTQRKARPVSAKRGAAVQPLREPGRSGQGGESHDRPVKAEVSHDISQIRDQVATVFDPSAIIHSLWGILALAVAVWIVTHLPVVPYNLRALPNPYHPWVAPLVLAAFLYWVLAIPAWAARWLEVSATARLLFPLGVVLQGTIAWLLARNGVLPEMIHKVAGAPVLGWGWDWETLMRFGVLEGTIFLLLTGGAVVARAIFDKTNPKGVVAWLAWSVCLLPISHYVIVANAATDNLVELMAGGGSVMASLMIAAWITVVGMGGFLAARSMSLRASGGWRPLLPLAASIPLGYVLVSLGVESSVEKFGKVFSGLQFLLSADRAHYAEGWELWIRYLAFHGALLCAAALTQYPLWRKARR